MAISNLINWYQNPDVNLIVGDYKPKLSDAKKMGFDRFVLSMLFRDKDEFYKQHYLSCIEQNLEYVKRRK